MCERFFDRQLYLINYNCWFLCVHAAMLQSRQQGAEWAPLLLIGLSSRCCWGYFLVNRSKCRECWWFQSPVAIKYVCSYVCCFLLFASVETDKCCFHLNWNILPVAHEHERNFKMTFINTCNAHYGAAGSKCTVVLWGEISQRQLILGGILCLKLLSVGCALTRCDLDQSRISGNKQW